MQNPNALETTQDKTKTMGLTHGFSWFRVLTTLAIIALLAVAVLVGTGVLNSKTIKVPIAMAIAKFTGEEQVLNFADKYGIRYEDLGPQWIASESQMQPYVNRLHDEYYRLVDEEYKKRAPGDAIALLADPPQSQYVAYNIRLRMLLYFVDNPELKSRLQAEHDRIQPLMNQEAEDMLAKPFEQRDDAYWIALKHYRDEVQDPVLKARIQEEMNRAEVRFPAPGTGGYITWHAPE
jgi:hypothetical protein